MPAEGESRISTTNGSLGIPQWVLWISIEWIYRHGILPWQRKHGSLDNRETEITHTAACTYGLNRRDFTAMAKQYCR